MALTKARLLKHDFPVHATNKELSAGLTEMTETTERGVSETESAKTGSSIDVRIDDAGSILKFRIGFSP